MMVTPIEGIELLVHLQENNRLNQKLKDDCEQTVRKFRLDHPTGNGKRSYLRRTYTCPFFEGQELGCSLSRSIKPYGCLAFNVHHQEIKAREHCFSETELLKQREEAFAWEEKKNQELKTKYQIFWDKTPLPLALLDLWDKKINAADLVPN